MFQELYGKTALPVTEETCRPIVAIPVRHGLSDEEVDYLVSAIKASLGG